MHSEDTAVNDQQVTNKQYSFLYIDNSCFAVVVDNLVDANLGLHIIKLL